MLDGGPGGARGAPPAIDQVNVNVWAVRRCVAVDEDAVVSARSVFRGLGRLVRSGRP